MKTMSNIRGQAGQEEENEEKEQAVWGRRERMCRESGLDLSYVWCSGSVSPAYLLALPFMCVAMLPSLLFSSPVLLLLSCQPH